MAIISRSKLFSKIKYINSQHIFALIYIFVTLVVLLILNTYTFNISQKLFYQNKESSMIEKCLLTSEKIAGLDVLNTSTAAVAVSDMGSLRVSRLIITDASGIAVYDSLAENSCVGSYVLLPEIVRAAKGYNVFTWNYENGMMLSRAATPIQFYGTLIGCVYMAEYDTAQGALIQSLQSNIFTITLVLELAIIAFSVVFATFSAVRLRKIFTSMQIIREGDYTHKVDMGGRDELTLLGDEFNELTAKLQISEGQRRQFVSDASHELKTPLASIKLLSDSILQNDMDMDTVREFVNDIGNEADRLNRMSQKLLSLSRVEALPDAESQIIDVAPTIEKVSKMLSGIAREHEVTIRLDLKEDATILASTDDLYQIIFNLMENGIKYNAKGGTLTVTLIKKDNLAQLSIADTGVGIPKDAIEHVFERFYRVDKARSRKSGGSGLGLAIVHSMVKRNGGDIRVTSALGKGSTFVVTFPICKTTEG